MNRTFRTALASALIALVGGALPTNAPAQDRRPMTALDLWAMDRVGTPALSPDGSVVVVPVTRYSMEDNRGNADLWMAWTDGSLAPRRLTYHEKSDSSPVFHPDGKQVAFLSKRAGGPAQLYLLPIDGGEARALTDLPIAVVDPKWLPDGSGIVFLARTWPDLNDDFDAVKERVKERDDDKVKAKITENRNLRYWDHYTTDGRVWHFFRLDLATEAVHDLTPGATRLMNFESPAGDWDLSADGKEIAFSANSTEPPYRTLDFDLFVMSLERAEDGRHRAGEPKNITEANPAADLRPRYSPSGAFLMYGRNARAEVHPDFTRLARYDREKGEITDLTDGTGVSPAGWEIAADSGTIFFHAQSNGRTHLYAMRSSGGDPVVLDEGGVTSNVTPGPPGPVGLLVYREESIRQPPELMILRNDGTGAKRLTHFNDERLAALDLGTVEDVVFRGWGDERVQMWIVYPPNFTPRTDWPLLQVIHGGPHGATLDRWHTRWNLALFASTGAVVTAVNFHGSTGFGQFFAESILGNHAEKPFVDVMLATDYMVGRGYIDKKRMAAGGGSYGGYLTCWILGHTDRFAALINHAGVYDLLSQYSSDWTWGRDKNYGASPWTDPGRIDLYSPSRYAASFVTPTLSLHGEKDYRVPVHQAIQLHQVLTAKGVRSKLAIFPEENHFILTPHGARLWWGEVFAWMREYIGTE